MIITDLAAAFSNETKGHPLVVVRNALYYSETKNEFTLGNGFFLQN